MERKNEKAAAVIPKGKVPELIPVPTIDCNHVMDRRGCTYVWKPKALPPYAKHSIQYPKSSNIGDEDIPLHNTSGKSLNGAEPSLILAAAYMEMKHNTKADPVVIYHLEKAIGRLMQLNLLERVS